jgi:hypothetical protein
VSAGGGCFDPTLAGQVARWHAAPTLRSQSVAEHSWQVARVLLAIWPEAPASLLRETLFHDVGEIGTGDVPSHAKSDEILRIRLSSLEKTARLHMVLPWGVPPPKLLNPFEAFWLGVAHEIADWEFLVQEVLMGNRMMSRWMEGARGRVDWQLDNVPSDSDLQKTRATEYIRKRKEAWL